MRIILYIVILKFRVAPFYYPFNKFQNDLETAWFLPAFQCSSTSPPIITKSIKDFCC